MSPEPGAPGRLRLVSLALPDSTPAAVLAERLSRRVALPCALVPAAAPPELRTLPGRSQLDARPLLDCLERTLEPGEICLAFTGHDLGLPVFSHVFGLAQDGGRTAVVSLARLDPAFDGLPPDRERLLERVLAEAQHELGHVAGLRHCHQVLCLMRFAGTVEKVDSRGQAFCASCRARLPAWLRPPGLSRG